MSTLPRHEALAAPDEWVIEPRGRRWSAQVREVWQYRRLFRFFGKRAVERLYRGTFLGIAWLFIRPLFPLTVRTLVFGGLLGVKSPGVPYFLFLLVGSSIWDLFSSCLMWAMRSLQMNKGFLGRMYFPRLIVPAATMSIAFVNFLIVMGVLAAALAVLLRRAGAAVSWRPGADRLGPWCSGDGGRARSRHRPVDGAAQRGVPET